MARILKPGAQGVRHGQFAIRGCDNLSTGVGQLPDIAGPAVAQELVKELGPAGYFHLATALSGQDRVRTHSPCIGRKKVKRQFTNILGVISQWQQVDCQGTQAVAQGGFEITAVRIQ
jgi:hypothetical protein